MNQTHIHLLITHLPLFGVILGSLVLAYGIWSKSDHTKSAAYYLFVISALGAGIAYLTGESAEDSVENIQGITKSMIENHENAAMFALIATIILGIASLVGLYLNFRKALFSGKMAIIVLLFSLFNFSVIARTAYLGGQIRHSEINSNAQTQNQNQSDEHEDKD